MSRKAIQSWALGAALAVLAGCAPVPTVMRADPQPLAREMVWPGPPDKARYRYVGQLLGEENFVDVDNGMRSSGTKLLKWIIGIGEEEQKVTLKRPQTGVVDSAGRVFVSDIANHALMVFDPSDGKLKMWTRADTRQNFVTPVGVALGAGGTLLVADADLARVVRLDANGEPVGSIGAGVLVRPAGVARDPARGRIYVADTHAHDVKVFDDAGTLLNTIGRRGDGEGELNFPTHLAFGGDRLYVADTMNARIQMYDADGTAAGTLGRRGLTVGQFTRPKGVALDHEGNLYVIESYYDRLLVYDARGRFLMPLGGSGREVGQFYLPSGVWTDTQGRIYVADMFNGRVVMFQFLGGKE